jgi:hypothetical protein
VNANARVAGRAASQTHDDRGHQCQHEIRFLKRDCWIREVFAKGWSIALLLENPNVISGYNLLAATRILFYCAAEHT